MGIVHRRLAPRTDFPKADPNQHYVRPPWKEVLVKSLGMKVKCDCEEIIRDRGILKEHWMAGHFDFWESNG
jgi:hypothetical protein